MDRQQVSNSMESQKLPLGENLAVITICVDRDSLGQFKSLVRTSRMVQLRAELSSYVGEKDSLPLLDAIKNLQPDICLLDFDVDREQATLTAERIHEAFANVAIFATSKNAAGDLILRAMRCGCTEYLLKPLDRDDLLEALARVGARKKAKPEQAIGQIATFLGTKGGCGVTTLSIHLAALLKSSCGLRTLLVDFHPDLGDAALFLSLDKYPYNFYDLAENTHRLDSELLQGFLVRHSSGLEILPAPDAFSGLHRQISVENIETTLDFLRTCYDFVVVDLPSGLNEHNVVAIRRSDLLYLITTPEIPAVRNLAHYLDYLNRCSFPPERVHVVVNRHSKQDTVPVDQIEKAVRKEIFWKIPNQYAEVIKMINLGAAGPRGGSSEFMRSMNGWAEILTGRSKTETKKKGILGLWG